MNKPTTIRSLGSTMSGIRFRKHVSIPVFPSVIPTSLTAIPNSVRHRVFTLVDCLMSGAAIFKLKAPSLLCLDRVTSDKTARRDCESIQCPLFHDMISCPFRSPFIPIDVLAKNIFSNSLISPSSVLPCLEPSCRH